MNYFSYKKLVQYKELQSQSLSDSEKEIIYL